MKKRTRIYLNARKNSHAFKTTKEAARNFKKLKRVRYVPLPEFTVVTVPPPESIRLQVNFDEINKLSYT